MTNLPNLSPAQLETLSLALLEMKERGEPIPTPILKPNSSRDVPLLVPDCAQWIDKNVTITEPNARGDSESVIPFRLWNAQRAALSEIFSHKQVIFLKARQLGISWLIVAYCVWLCIYHANKVVLVISKDVDSAKQLIKRARGVFVRLKVSPAFLTVDNTQELAWHNGSVIKSLAASEDAGSSYTASVVVLDEFAKMRFAESVYNASKPTIDGGGQIIVVSTAKGRGNRFAELWRKARAGLNNFHAIFIPWFARPDRDQAWYSHTALDAVSQAAHMQEYPASEDEAFQELSPEKFLQDMAWWRACRNDQLPSLDKHTPIIIALDAAVNNDSFALVAVSLNPVINNGVAIRFAQQWKPLGGKIDYNDPMQVVTQLIKNYDVAMVTGDPYQLHYFFSLVRDNLDVAVSEFNQGPDRLEADMQLRALVMNRRIEYIGEQPDLTEHIDNADVKVSEDRRLRLVKRHEAAKIDLAVALAMAAYKCLKVLSF
jgi:hypothetical protein